MLHIVVHIIRYIIGVITKENARPVTISAAQQKAQVYERAMRDMDNIERMSKDDFITHLGKPDKITKLEQGMQNLIWKGSKYKIEILVDALDRFHHKTESYT